MPLTCYPAWAARIYWCVRLPRLHEMRSYAELA